jgi:hypothetical protein
MSSTTACLASAANRIPIPAVAPRLLQAAAPAKLRIGLPQ